MWSYSFALNVSSVFLFRRNASSKEKTSALRSFALPTSKFQTLNLSKNELIGNNASTVGAAYTAVAEFEGTYYHLRDLFLASDKGEKFDRSLCEAVLKSAKTTSEQKDCLRLLQNMLNKRNAENGATLLNDMYRNSGNQYSWLMNDFIKPNIADGGRFERVKWIRNILEKR